MLATVRQDPDMADRKLPNQEIDGGAATPDPKERRIPGADRLNAIELELLAALARQDDPATAGSAAPHAATPPAGEHRPLDQMSRPNFEDDALGLLHTLASRGTGPAEQDDTAPPAAAEERSFALEASVAPHTESDTSTQPARRSPWRPSGRPAMLIAVSVLSLAAVVGFTGLLWSWLSASGSVKTRQTKPETNIAIRANEARKPLVTPGAPVVSPTDQKSPNFLMAQKAMNDCDQAAAKDLDSIFFLVIPVKSAQGPSDTLAQQGDRSDKFTLLPSKVAMAGLQDNSIELQAKRYAFAATDTASSKTQKFDVADGISRFVWRDNSTVLNFKVGFEAAGLGTGTQWSGKFSRVRGVCYWVNVLFKE
jgi:hypothetical protein